jgi:hypothetical protein
MTDSPVPEHWQADPELAQHLIATFGSLEQAARQLQAAGADLESLDRPGWTPIGTTDDGGILYIAPPGTPPPGPVFKVEDPAHPAEITGPPEHPVPMPPWAATSGEDTQ